MYPSAPSIPSLVVGRWTHLGLSTAELRGGPPEASLGLDMERQPSLIPLWEGNVGVGSRLAVGDS